MDAIASLSTQGWELLAQLATLAHQADAPLDTPALLRRVAELLGRSLPCPWGLLVTGGGTQEGSDGLPSAASWGLSADQRHLLLTHNGQVVDLPAARFDLPGDDGRSSYLLLAHEAGQGPPPDIAFSTALAAQIALLLDLQRRRNTERLAAALQQIARAAGTQPPLEELCELLLGQLATLVPYSQAALLLLPEEPGTQTSILRLYAAAPPPYGTAALPPPDAPLYRAALAGGTPVVRSAEFASTDQALLLVPLRAGEPLGLLVLLSLPHYAYGASARDTAGAFATQAAQAIATARRFAQERQRARELFVLYENSKVIGTTTQLVPLLNRLIENIALAMGADRCAAALVDIDAPDTLRIVASYGGDATNDPLGSAYALSQQPEIGVLLAHDAPQVIADVPGRYASGREGDNITLQALHWLGYRSGLVLSLRTQERPVGLLAIGYTDGPHCFTQGEINLAATLANQLATAVVNAQFAAAEQRRAAELELLQSISQRLSADLSIDETLQAISEGVGKLVPFTDMEICLYNAQNQVFEALRTNGSAAPVMQRTYETDEGLTGWLARHRRPLRMDDVTQRSPNPLADPQVSGGAVRAYLGVPLQVGDELVGTLELVSTRPSDFSANHERLLTIIAGQAAQAIRNAMRYEQTDEHLRSRLQQLNALQRVSSQLTIMLLQSDILAFVLEQARKATTAGHGFIALYEPVSGDDQPQAEPGYRVIAVDGYADAERTVLLARPLDLQAATAFSALQKGEPELAEELRDAERAAVRCPDARSALAVPIFYEAEVVGVICLFSPLPHGFDHDALMFVRALADQSALAIGNSQRYQEQVRLNELIQRRAAMLNNVLEIAATLRADGTIEEMLEQVGYSVIETTGFRRVLFNLIDHDNPEVLRVVAGAGIPLDELKRLRAGVFPLDLALRYLDPRFRIGRSFFVPAEVIDELNEGFDVEAFTTHPNIEADTRGPHEWQVKDELLVPLYSTEGTGLIGLISVDDPLDCQRPSVRTVEPLEIFAEQVAIAVENLYLVHSAREHAEQMTALSKERERRIAELDVINRISNITSSTLNLEQMLGQVHDCLADFLSFDAFYALVYRADRNEVILTFTIDEEQQRVGGVPYTPDQGSLSERIIRTRQPLLYRRLVEELDAELQPVFFGNTERASESWLGVPLLVGEGEVVGVISVQSYTPALYSERERSFLSTVASQLALGVQNARLFVDRDQRIAELDVVNRVGSIVNATLNLEQMLGQVYDCLADFLPVDACYIYIYNAERNEISLRFDVDEGFRQVDAEHPIGPRQAA